MKSVPTHVLEMSCNFYNLLTMLRVMHSLIKIKDAKIFQLEMWSKYRTHYLYEQWHLEMHFSRFFFSFQLSWRWSKQLIILGLTLLYIAGTLPNLNTWYDLCQRSILMGMLSLILKLLFVVRNFHDFSLLAGSRNLGTSNVHSSSAQRSKVLFKPSIMAWRTFKEKVIDSKTFFQ